MGSSPGSALHALELEGLGLESVLSLDRDLVLFASALLSLSDLDHSSGLGASDSEELSSGEGLSSDATSLSGELLVSGAENGWSVESVLEAESLGSTLGSLDASGLWIGDGSLDASDSSVSEGSLLADSDTEDLDSSGADDLALLGELESLASSDDVLASSGDASELLSLGRPLSESLGADLSNDLSGWTSLSVDEGSLDLGFGNGVQETISNDDSGAWTSWNCWPSVECWSSDGVLDLEASSSSSENSLASSSSELSSSAGNSGADGDSTSDGNSLATSDSDGESSTSSLATSDSDGESYTSSLATSDSNSSEALSGLVESQVGLLASASLSELQGHGSLESSSGLSSVDLELSHL